MLNITPISGSHQVAAASYFSSVDDYYERDEPGQWQGQGAAALGLMGPVDQTEFARMLSGQLPDGQRIAASFDAAVKRKRMGLDLTFSAPKSVSMQALIGGDAAVVAAHDRAVTRALAQVETLAQARVKRAGVSQRERTGNLVIAKFRHHMSRSEDPQLHTHAVVLNMTRRSDGAWRALCNEDIFHAKKAIDGIYQVELASELMALGYRLRVVDDRGNFELDHIAREQIEAFSARSQVIELALSERGKSRAGASTAEKQVIALATRPRKGASDAAAIRKDWIERSRAHGIVFDKRGPDMPGPDRRRLASADPSAGTAAPDGHPTTLDDCEGDRRRRAGLPAQLSPAQAVVQYAIRHLTERESVVLASELSAVALQRAVGLANAAQVDAEIRRLVEQGTLVRAEAAYRGARLAGGPALSRGDWVRYLQTTQDLPYRSARAQVAAAIAAGTLAKEPHRYTTQAALQREKAILAIERAGRGKVEPIVDANVLARRLTDPGLTPGQRAAIQAMVATRHRFVGVEGDAGTGKTYAVNRAVALIADATAANGERYQSVALAPYGNQVKALRNEGLNAMTLARFLHSRNRELGPNTVVLLDEAGVVGARQMVQLLRVVEKAQARLVMIGDTKQLLAIEAGKPFAQLQAAGMQTARITEIQRQKDPMLRQAVHEAAQGRIPPSLANLTALEQYADANARHRAVVAAYTALDEAARRTALMVTGTNAARRELNELARMALGLQGTGRRYETLTRVDMTQAQRRYAASYQLDMVVMVERNCDRAGLAAKEPYRVKKVLPRNRLVVAHQDGALRVFDPRAVPHLVAYHAERTELAVGDLVRVTRSDAARGVTMGERLHVIEVKEDEVALVPADQSGRSDAPQWRMPAGVPLHLEHAYASTVHSAQGLTCDRVYIALNTRSRTASMNSYYVAISRARYEARVYTDSIGRLPGAISRRSNKTIAIGILRERDAGRRLPDRNRTAPVDGATGPLRL